MGISLVNIKSQIVTPHPPPNPKAWWYVYLHSMVILSISLVNIKSQIVTPHPTPKHDTFKYVSTVAIFLKNLSNTATDSFLCT